MELPTEYCGGIDGAAVGVLSVDVEGIGNGFDDGTDGKLFIAGGIAPE